MRAPPSVLGLTKVQFAAAVDGTADQAVTWSLDEPFVGAIDANGIYDAYDGGGFLVHVRATSVADPTASVTIPVDVGPALRPAMLAPATSLRPATGMANQTRLVHASELGAWWLFYETTSAPTQVLTRTSSDFATWTEGPALELGHPHGLDGRNLTVADRVINGVQVVHVSAGFVDASRGRVHAKATLGAGGLVWGAPVETNKGGNLDPDGPAVAITESGYVIDASGWDATPQTPPLSPCGDGDVEVYTSAQPDTGPTSFDTMTFDKRVVWCVPNRVDARYLFADGETLYHLYEDGTTDPDPVNLLYDIRRADGTWLPPQVVRTMPPSVLATDSTFSLNDWTARSDGHALHALRRLADSTTFEHALLPLGSEGPWTTAPPPSAATAIAGSGIFLAPYGIGMIALQINASNGIDYNFWDCATWNGWWQLAAPDGMPRIAIAGSTIATGDDRPAILWDEAGALFGVVLP